jgi:hypothetical protein
LDRLGERGIEDESADGGEGAAVVVIVGVFVIVRVCVFVGVAVVVLVRVGVGVGLVRVGVFVVGVSVGLLGGVAVLEDGDAGSGDAAAVGFFDAERDAEIEGGGGAVEDLRVEAGVEEGRKEHVAANAGEAVEIGVAHGGYCFLRL